MGLWNPNYQIQTILSISEHFQQDQQELRLIQNVLATCTRYQLSSSARGQNWSSISELPISSFKAQITDKKEIDSRMRK